MEQLVARQAHNLEVGDSNSPSATRSFDTPILWRDEITSRKHVLVAKGKGATR